VLLTSALQCLQLAPLALQLLFLLFRLALLFSLPLFLFLDCAAGCGTAESAKYTTNYGAFFRVACGTANNGTRTGAKRCSPQGAALTRGEWATSTAGGEW
jgi:hypothetical protein